MKRLVCLLFLVLGVACAALAEYESMKKDSTAYKRYDSFDGLMDEVLRDA